MGLYTTVSWESHLTIIACSQNESIQKHLPKSIYSHSFGLRALCRGGGRLECIMATLADIFTIS